MLSEHDDYGNDLVGEGFLHHWVGNESLLVLIGTVKKEA